MNFKELQFADDNTQTIGGWLYYKTGTRVEYYPKGRQYRTIIIRYSLEDAVWLRDRRAVKLTPQNGDVFVEIRG